MTHSPQYPQYEFHVSRTARDKYQFDETLFSVSGTVIFADFRASRLFAQKMNDKRDLISFPEHAVRSGQLNAMGLIDEILHVVIELYREREAPKVMAEALAFLEKRLGKTAVDDALQRFADAFPPVAVYRREIELDDYLKGQTAGVSHREMLLEEMMQLGLANANPAFAPYLELFDDDVLERHSAYPAMIAGLHDFFATKPHFGPDSESLIQMLRRPAREVPYSLQGQLEYILQRWGYLLGKYLYRLLRSLDVLEEEGKPIFLGPGPSIVYDFAGLAQEPERYSPDREWMPRLVLLAKNSYVWLDQLSKKYQRDIVRLDQVPDEELGELAQRGFSGLWLIGLWERSRASREIKQRMGNPEAVASAYSLMEYQIAEDLGGEDALENLRERAWQRGIRLSSDMVPNHTGIDSNWVMDHPDWFVQLDHSPFPSYTFNGPDLSTNDRVGVYLEDHYYSRDDAAVVFKHVDRPSGRDRYIYHGNDGTSMPWNDTAQLNYLLPEVREAVIQTILDVARRFRVIRFDAAMTLTKKHYQRLWFPEPGTGGAIPSRAEHGLTKGEFDSRMPEEFWREVVDRVAREVPDTLLLAEAFWLMEGYFVRSLGMHRVYNSAFMNMLRDEMNAEYRQLIKNTLEFDPEILKRYVNFMNNPDERTAVDQFGKGDKYFGVCTLLATLPGLPMFGHGQVEGLAEKYGMEFRRAYWDEEPDESLIQRHEREIFPLLHKRNVFAEVADFRLYDFFDTGGFVNENVFAYSNRSGNERGLVVYHNQYGDTRGWIRTSAAFSRRTGSGQRMIAQANLGEGLGLSTDEGLFCIFRDEVGGLEYIRRSKDFAERGLFVELGAYQRHVFLDFRELPDNEWGQYGQLESYLNGRGVPSIDEALREITLQPIHGPFRELLSADSVRRLMAARVTSPSEEVDAEVLDDVESRLLDLLRGIKNVTDLEADEQPIARQVRAELEAVLRLPVLRTQFTDRQSRAAAVYVQSNLGEDRATWGTLFAWLFSHALGKLCGEENFEEQSRAWVDEWMLSKVMVAGLEDLGLDNSAAWRAVRLIRILHGHQCWFSQTNAEALVTTDARRETPGRNGSDGAETSAGLPYRVVETWLKDQEVQRFLQVNRYMGVLWFDHASFQELVWWMLTLAAIELGREAEGSLVEREAEFTSLYEVVQSLQEAEAESQYQVEELLKNVKQTA